MKRKFISICIALVLVLSFTLVTGVPVAADPVRLNLISVGVDSVAEWVDAETIAPHTGAYSLKLYALDGGTGGAGVYIPVNVAIEDIESLSFARLGSIGDKDAKINLLIDANNDGDLDFTEIEALTYHHDSALVGGLDVFGEDAMLWLNPKGLIDTDTWDTVDVYNTGGGAGGSTYSYWGTDKTGTLHWTNNAGLGDAGGVQEVGSLEGGAIDPTDKVLGVIVLLGCGSGVADQTVYIDDIEINGITYELEEALSGWHVYDGQSIQDAIDIVASGDTINVEPGTYLEHILIDEALTVRSTDGAEVTIIDSNAYRYKVTIQHSDVTFEGFTVTDPNYAGGSDATGILIHANYDEDVSNVQILDNIVTQVSSETGTPSYYGTCGINVGYAVSKGNTLSDIVISGNTITDIKNPEGGASDHTCGINVWDGAEGVVISNNTISDIKYNGIILERASNVRIEGNSITECKVGVRVQPFEEGAVSGLTVNFNNIAGNTEYDLLSNVPIDATNNWWGTAIESQIAKLVSDSVVYSPWFDALDGEPTTVDVTSISLESGWNLISLPLIPEDSSIEAVLAGTELTVIKVAYYTGDPEGPEGGWLNYAGDLEISDLTQMQDGKGYWIDMNTAGALTIRGHEICAPPPAVPPSYNLVEGWNLIGFKALAIDTAMTTYFGKAVMDTMEAGYGYDASAGLYTIIKSTDKLVPGDGYWLAVSADGTIYP